MKVKIILISIMALGLFFRTFALSSAPPGFNADEAALGYNAYSLLKTGKDEWGESFPLVFKSFSDYKPGLYVYLSMPFVAILGLNEMAVRLPSIILGTLTILVVYFLAKKIYESEILALSCAFLLAISPWHIHYSRGAWETNVATFFITLGVYAFVLGLSNWKWLLFSGVSFILSMYAYQSPRLIAPMLVVLLALSYGRKIITKKNLVVGVICAILLLPMIVLLFSGKDLSRFQGVSIFTDTGIQAKLNQDRGEHANPGGIYSKIVHNRLIAYGHNFFEHYLDHFTPRFLFIEGDPLGRNKVPEMGQMYLFEMVTVLFGLYFLSTAKLKNRRVIFIWLAISPVAASLTYQTPHALRAENMVIPLTLISGSGLGFILRQISKLRNILKILSFAVVGLIICYFVSLFMHEYLVHLPQTYALEWNYGFPQMAKQAFLNKDKYGKVVITTRYDQPYIFMLFYSQYDPVKFQQSAKPLAVDSAGFSTISSFDNFEFRRISKDEIDKSANTLFIAAPEEVKNFDKFTEVINFPNGKPAFEMIGKN